MGRRFRFSGLTPQTSLFVDDEDDATAAWLIEGKRSPELMLSITVMVRSYPNGFNSSDG